MPMRDQRPRNTVAGGAQVLRDESQAVADRRRLVGLEADDDVQVVVVRDQRPVPDDRQDRSEPEANVRRQRSNGLHDAARSRRRRRPAPARSSSGTVASRRGRSTPGRGQEAGSGSRPRRTGGGLPRRPRVRSPPCAHARTDLAPRDRVHPAARPPRGQAAAALAVFRRDVATTAAPRARRAAVVFATATVPIPGGRAPVGRRRRVRTEGGVASMRNALSETVSRPHAGWSGSVWMTGPVGRSTSNSRAGSNSIRVLPCQLLAVTLAERARSSAPGASIPADSRIRAAFAISMRIARTTLPSMGKSRTPPGRGSRVLHSALQPAAARRDVRPTRGEDRGPRVTPRAPSWTDHSARRPKIVRAT